jgi:hypothetical protein
MAENSLPQTASTSVRWWVFCVSFGLWLFAAWQLYLLPYWLPVFLKIGLDFPQISSWLFQHVPIWAPIMFGGPCSLLAAFTSRRSTRAGLLALALFAAFVTHMGNVFLQLKLHYALKMTPEERAARGWTDPTD